MRKFQNEIDGRGCSIAAALALPSAQRLPAPGFAEAQLQQFEPGASIYHLGDPPGGIYGIAAGALAISIAPGEGGPYLAHLANPGDWFGEAAFITGHGASGSRLRRHAS